MTPAQRGAYWQLICWQMQSDDGHFDDDVGLLSALSDLDLSNGNSIVVESFPVQENGRRANARALKEWHKRRAISATRSNVGKVGSGKRWQNDSKPIAKGMAIGTTSTTTSTSKQPQPKSQPEKKEKEGDFSPLLSDSKAPIKNKKPKYSEAFETVWGIYGKYGSKPTAWKYWRKLSDTDQASIIDTIPDYLACVDAGRTKKQFEGWINPENRIWDMDWEAVLADMTKPIKARQIEAVSYLDQLGDGTGGL